MSTHRLTINGKAVTRCEWLRKRMGGAGTPMVTSAYSTERPLKSEASGCMKHQVPELREFVHDMGIRGVRVLDDGAVEFSSRKGRNEYLKARGMVDNDGGYGEP